MPTKPKAKKKKLLPGSSLPKRVLILEHDDAPAYYTDTFDIGDDEVIGVYELVEVNRTVVRTDLKLLKMPK